MQLIFLALQVIKKAPDAFVFAFTFDNLLLLFWVKIGPGSIEWNSSLAGKAFQLGCVWPVFRFRPRFNQSFIDSLGWIRDDEVEIKINRISKTLAARTCPERIVKRKQPRLRLFILQMTTLALETMGEAQALRSSIVSGNSLKYHFARFPITRLNRIDNTGSSVRRNRYPVNQ